jgi:L-fuconolactonase
MFIDAHAHSWDPTVLPYDWLSGESRLDRPLLYRRDAGDAVVFVEGGCRGSHAVAEASWAASLRAADGEPLFARIVAGLRLDDPRRGEQLAALGAVPRVVGVRHVLQGLPVEALRDPELARGLSDVARAALAFDVCVRPGQLGDALALLRAVPNGRYVIDHLGAPPEHDSVDSDAARRWRADLRRAAEETGAVVKLSGAGLAVDGPPAAVARARDRLRVVFDLFGPDRCMVGSDWPVSTGPERPSPRSWAAFVLDTLRLTGADRVAVASATASAFYRLSVDQPPLEQF